MALKSITAYRKDESTLWNTASTSAVVPGVFVGAPQLGILTGAAPIYDIQHSQVSEELQLTETTDTLKWVTGFFWLGEHGSQLEADILRNGVSECDHVGSAGFRARGAG